ncbi:hybrid sensor histidine kinase/response regulator transcription factor [Proteiniphilum sp. UBA5510]|uniref:hybrid sensor histidine kinase/response regulator transcription factor n=1 Tax=Proteiniphilum sp. UBA5510 TaxID=1947286 RepID=UPI00257EC4CD|nr:hybrid sensor histidine kinase/response regulator transcription factor [Proteiniphilum sp. UBA5510]
MNIIKLFLIITLIGVNSIDISGDSSYIFYHLSTEDGLSNNSVKTILRDSHGFLWIGTEFGLNRYDGYGFKTFLAQPNMPNSMTANNILGLQEDGLKNIWIDFGDSYAVYNSEKNNFITDINIILKKFSIKTNGNRKIYIDKKKNLFVITLNEIYFYNVAAKKLNIYKSPKFNFSNIEVSDDLGNLYIVDSKDLCWQMEKKSGKFNKIVLPTASDFDYQNKRTKIFADSGGGLWLYSDKEEYVNFRQINSSLWQKIYLNSSIKSQNNILSIIEGHNGQIWIATDHKGLFLYDKSTSSLINITSNSLSPTSIASNYVSSILVDNTGTLWVGYIKNGISFFNESFQNFINVQNDQCRNISRIVELRNGNILLGTDGDGVYLTNYITNAVIKLPIPNTAITALFEDNKGHIWIGTYQYGLYCFYHNKLKHFTTTNSNLSSDNIWGIVEDKYENLWIGTLGGKIHKYNINDNKNYFETPFKDTRSVSGMFYDGDKTIYAATGYGLTIIDIDKNTNQVFLGNKKGNQQFNQLQISIVYKDSRNHLWIGTNAGLTIWDLKKDSLSYFDISDGLSGNIIRGIAEDNSHNIWVTTSKGLSVIMLDNNNRIRICRNFSIRDGIKNDYFNNNAICKLKNGNILAGTTDGYTIINPLKVAVRKEPSARVYLTKLIVANTVINVDSVYNGHVILNKSIESMSELNLKYNDRLVTLEFTTVDLINADKVKYRYKIDGFTNQWVTTKRNEIAITSLPTGKYRLLIEACNSEGIWNNEAKVLLINVAPPFYYSSWAIMLYILVALAIVLFLIYRGQRRHQMKLEQQINEMKLRFFTNISHDLRTPLTLIITPLQTLLKDITDDSLKKKLEVMFKNAQQLLSLINSLLDFRKLDVGAEVLHLKPGNIFDLVREIYSSFAVYATERKINFILNNSHENLWVKYDQDKMYKSIVNLLSNAFKYTPNGGIIKLNLFIDETDVCISVSDNGIGISNEDKELVFNRFYQTSNNSRKTGSGIGLHIVSEYIKLHKGSIDIIDNKPSGCIFTLRFPLIETTAVKVTSEDEYVEEYQDPQHEEIYPQMPVLLFVDDNQDLCEFIHDNLMNDYSVLIANDGQEALAFLTQNDVNIIVSDIMMPVMDGIELCRQIKTNIEWSHIPVILLTAKTADEHKIEGLEIGADDYVTKPFNLDILKLRILKFFEWSLKSHKTFRQKLDVNPHEITITTLDEKLIDKAISIVEKHISDTEFSVEILGEALGLSRGHLYRKLMAITGKGPAEFIRLVRLKRGKQLLEKSQLPISQIAYQVGFNSPKRFTKQFREEFGMSPSEFIRTLKSGEIE